MKSYVYILYSKSIDRLYKGQTNNIINRLHRHNSGYEKATKHGAPWVLLWKTEKNSKGQAMVLEKKLKNLNRARTLSFIQKYDEGICSYDEFLLVQKLSRC